MMRRKLDELKECNSGSNCKKCISSNIYRKKLREIYGDFICPRGIVKNDNQIKSINEKIKSLGGFAEIKKNDRYLPKEFLIYLNKLEREKTKEDKIEKTLTTIKTIDIIKNKLKGDLEAQHLLKDVENFISKEEIAIKVADKSTNCIYKKEIINKEMKSCCGGKLKEIITFNCEKHGPITIKRCRNCTEREE